ncbi:MAG: cupin domain-containing protein, partial [Firmicutes bacterium]|nr:cupin domain-containing protein [Bacillota bacterium]
SQLENDLSSPSIATLEDILKALGISLATFFKDSGDEQIVFPKDSQFEKENTGYTVRWLVPSAQKNAMEPILTKIAVGASTETDYPHEGEEFGFVLKGEIVLKIGERVVKAKKGDTFYYHADKTHCIENVGNGEAEVVWVSCPPNF